VSALSEVSCQSAHRSFGVPSFVVVGVVVACVFRRLWPTPGF
jgi:hypothetical protein